MGRPPTLPGPVPTQPPSPGVPPTVPIDDDDTPPIDIDEELDNNGENIVEQVLDDDGEQN